MATIGRTWGNIQQKSFSGSELPVVEHFKLSRLSYFRSASFELVLGSGRLSAEVLKQKRAISRMDMNIVSQLDSSYDREESRWIREEQRWLREEQRWQAEEARLSAENFALREEVSLLKEELGQLRSGQGERMDASFKKLVTELGALLQALADPSSEDSSRLSGITEERRQIAGSVSFSTQESVAYIVEKSDVEAFPVTFVSSSDEVVAPAGTSKIPDSTIPTPQAGVPDPSVRTAKEASNFLTKKRTLKSGMFGDDVKELQDALAELGFYSGEEEMEDSSFASNTARAVKTWQSSCGITEDGLVPVELMAALLAEVAAKMSTEEVKKNVTDIKSKPLAKTETPSNKPESLSYEGRREIDRYERSDAQETGSGSSRRVYLLGENRWEEPGRLISKTKPETKSKNGASIGMKMIEKCFSCRGELKMLCTECEGTGDLNVEEQFIEWVDEGAKCPYCAGSGAVPCDVCIRIDT